MYKKDEKNLEGRASPLSGSLESLDLGQMVAAEISPQTMHAARLLLSLGPLGAGGFQGWLCSPFGIHGCHPGLVLQTV
jgi:hypothetical protein